MYKEIFAAAKKNNPYIKLSEPASPIAISKAEAKLGCDFPLELKRCLLEMDGDGDLYFSAQKIAEENLDIRAALASCYPDLDQYLFFAGNGCGDYYGYRLTNGQVIHPDILLWDHEVNKAQTVAADLSTLITLMYVEGVL